MIGSGRESGAGGEMLECPRERAWRTMCIYCHIYLIGERGNRRSYVPRRGKFLHKWGIRRDHLKSEVVSIYGWILKLEAGHGKVR